MTEIAPNLLLSVGHFVVSSTDEMADECWTGSLFAGDGFSPRREFRKCVERISCKLRSSEILMHNAVPMHAICPAQISRKSSGQPCSSDNAIIVALGI